MSRLRGAGRAFVVTLVVLLALLAAIDLGLRFWAQEWVEDRIEETLRFSEPPSVSFRGFPFLPEFARGRFDAVGLEARGVGTDGIVIDRASLSLQNVSFDRSDLLSRRPGEIVVGRGRGEVRVNEEALGEALAARETPLTVELLGPAMRATGAIERRGQEIIVSATGPLRLRDETLVFAPREVEAEEGFRVPPEAMAFEVSLPEVAPGLAYERIEVQEGVVVLAVRLSRVRFGLEPG